MSSGSPPIDPARLDRNWRAISIELDAPRPSPMERMLRLVGFPSRMTRLVVATPALRRSWFLSTGLAGFLSLLTTGATDPREQLFGLLLVAPLVPVIGVAMAYGIDADPAHETAVATPMRGIRLLLTRAVVVVTFSSFCMALASIITPNLSAMAFAWLLPSLGLTTTTIAAMTSLRPRHAAVATSTVWVIGVLSARAGSSDPLAAFTSAGQFVMALVAVAGLLVTVARRNKLDLLPVRS